MNIEAFHLNSKKFVEQYTQQCHTAKDKTLISITFTLNPRMNNADILTQYRSLIKEIKSSNLFYYKTHHKDVGFTIHPGFIRLMLAPELTKTINVHLHGILVVAPEWVQYFKNEVRRICWDNPILGRQHAFHVVSHTLKDRTAVAKYPFKDTDQLLKFPDSAKIYYYNFQEII